MTGQQRKVVGVMVTLIVAGFVFMGIRSNRRKLQQDKLRKREEIKDEKTKRRTKSVVFAKENIKKRTEIKKEWLEVKEVEERDLPKQEYAKAMDEVVGKIALVDIYMGEPVIQQRYTDKDQVTALSFIIDKGMRAVSVNINTVDACGGFLKQGDKVDILATFSLQLDRAANSRASRVTSYLMRNVVVLAIDKVFKLNKDQKNKQQQQQQQKQNKGGSANPYMARASVSMVTFLVSPEDAEKLVIASQKSRLKLVLTPETGMPKDLHTAAAAITDGIFNTQRVVNKNEKKKPTQVKVEIIAGPRKREQFLRAEAPPPPPAPDASTLEPLEEPEDWGAGESDIGVSLPSLGP